MTDNLTPNVKFHTYLFLSDDVLDSKNNLQYWGKLLTSRDVRLTGNWLLVEDILILAKTVLQDCSQS